MVVVRLLMMAIAWFLWTRGHGPMPSPGSLEWNRLRDKRENLVSSVQIYQSSKSFSTQHKARTITSNLEYYTQVETRKTLWRESDFSYSEQLARIFDGTGILITQGSEKEYTREKHYDDQPLVHYAIFFDWNKITSSKATACKLRVNDKLEGRECIRFKVMERYGRSAWTISALVETKSGVIVEMEQRRAESQYSQSYHHRLTDLITSGEVPRARFDAPNNAHLVDRLTFNPQLPMSRPQRERELIGKHVPDLEYQALEGSKWPPHPSKLASFAKGHPVLIDFWASWCPPCRADRAAVNQLFQERRTAGLRVIGITGESPEAVKNFVAKNPVDFPVGIASPNMVQRVLLTEVIPTYIAVDSNGMIRATVRGRQGIEGLRRLADQVLPRNELMQTAVKERGR